jgi:hypothetical protein
MIIEQDKKQLHDAIALHTKAAVKSLRLAQSQVWSRPRATAGDIGDVSFDITFKPAAFNMAEGCLTIDTDFNFVIVEESKERSPVILIECRFEAQYELAPEYKPSEGEVEAFRAANAIFNCWPFFREYVQNTAVRMNLPPPSIPFLRIIRKEQQGPSTQKGLPHASPAEAPLVRPRRQKKRHS